MPLCPVCKVDHTVRNEKIEQMFDYIINNAALKPQIVLIYLSVDNFIDADIANHGHLEGDPLTLWNPILSQVNLSQFTPLEVFFLAQKLSADFNAWWLVHQ